MYLLTYDNLEVGDAGGSKVQLDVHNVFVSTTPLLQIQCLTMPYTLTVGASEQRDFGPSLAGPLCSLNSVSFSVLGLPGVAP